MLLAGALKIPGVSCGSEPPGVTEAWAGVTGGSVLRAPRLEKGLGPTRLLPWQAPAPAVSPLPAPSLPSPLGLLPPESSGPLVSEFLGG